MPAENILGSLSWVCGYDSRKPVLVAVSGGPDSLALLHILCQAGVNLVASHLDHMLRPSSSSEAEKVRRICTEWGLRCEIGQVDVAGFAEKNRLSIEEAARECRYHFLFDTADYCKAQAVITGHTADDQVETVLMHLLRGAGMSGLAGMSVVEKSHHWSKNIPLWRPMLGVWREQVISYCQQHHLDVIQDESNSDIKYFRNRLRHQVIPGLASVNPQIKQSLLRMADVIGEDDRLLEQVTDEIWQACRVAEQPGCLVLDRDLVLAQPLSLQRRMLRKGIQLMRSGLRDINFETIERSIRAIKSEKRSATWIDLANGLNLALEHEHIYFLEKGLKIPVLDLPQLIGSAPILMGPGDTIDLANDWKLNCRLVNGPDMRFIDQHLIEDPLDAWIAADGLQLPLIVRGRKPGETWKPLGLDGHTQKISDFYVNEKIPVQARQNWPLILSREQVIWIAGFRPAHDSSLKGNEALVLNLRLKKMA